VIKDIMSYFQPTRPNAMPTIVKNLIIINVLFFIATLVFEGQGIDLIRYLGMFPVQSDYFMPHQVVTHMFMHGGWQHILFNMFALWMFGSPLEKVWGPKRFLEFYMITGLGAAFLHQAVNAYEIYSGNYDPSLFGPVVGASGAVFGILTAFGMLYSNSLIYLYFAIPVKAKYVVSGLIIYELYRGFANNPNDNVAHFAHLGGALIAFILIKYWQRNRNHFY
jgi:membrane associated rhomboid family serine protease